MFRRTRLRRAARDAPNSPSDMAQAPPRRERYASGGQSDFADALGFLRWTEAQRAHSRAIDRIRTQVANGERVRIGFAVNEESKWNANELLETLVRQGFEAKIYLGRPPGHVIGSKREAKALERLHEFFQGKPAPTAMLYTPSNGFQLSADYIDSDVVFFQQPWGFQNYPAQGLGQFLSAYMHYGFPVVANEAMHYTMPGFHPYLWRYFAPTEWHKSLYVDTVPFALSAVKVTGYPKLDFYRQRQAIQAEGKPDAKSLDRLHLIYAPHHALDPASIQLGTFDWSGQLILEIASRRRDIRWTYKPHPKMRRGVKKSGLMSTAEYDRYVNAWDELPNAEVRDGGDYFDVFTASDGLITDCGSFLAEYMPTGSPILWLDSQKGVGLNAYGKRLAQGLYRCTDPSDLDAALEALFNHGVDPLAPIRASLRDELLSGAVSASEAVTREMVSELFAV